MARHTSTALHVRDLGKRMLRARRVVYECVAGAALCLVLPAVTAAQVGTAGRPIGPTAGMAKDPTLALAIRDVSASNIRQIDSMLVSFGTRHTLSDTVSATRGIGAARRYIFATLSAISAKCGGCLRVEYDPALVALPRAPNHPPVNVVNVLVSNAPTWLGLLERPDHAHTNYLLNPDVARMVACGEPRSARCE